MVNTTNVPRDHPPHDRHFKIIRLITILNNTYGDLRSVAEHFHRRKHGVFQTPQHDEAVLTQEDNHARLQDLVFILLLLRVSPQVQIYTGMKTQGHCRVTHRVVTDLVIPRFRNNNCVVYMDNFFTSIAIFKELSENGILACGIYRTNRTGLSADLAYKNVVKPLRRGEALFCHKGNTTAIVWMDKKLVYVISNAHQPTTAMVKRGNPDGSKSDVSCPTPVSEYIRHMGGVDLIDQHMCYYSYNCKSKCWWLHLYFHMFDLCIVNVSIHYKHVYRISFHPPMKIKRKDQLKFRKEMTD